MASTEGFPASFYGEPGVLGLMANGISAFLVLLQNFSGAQTGVPAQGVEDILAGIPHYTTKDAVVKKWGRYRFSSEIWLRDKNS